MADDLYKAYDQKLVMPTAPGAAANFAAQYGGGGVTAVGRATDSPSGTDWNQTFGQNNPYSPSGTDWANTFGPYRERMSSDIGSPSGTDWLKTFGRNNSALSAFTGFNIAGEPTPSPTPSKLIYPMPPGGSRNVPQLGPTIQERLKIETQRPSLAFFRNRFSNSFLTSRERDMYGAGSEFGFVT